MVFIGAITATGTNLASNFSLGASFSLRGNPVLPPKYHLVPDSPSMLFLAGPSGVLGASGVLNMVPLNAPGAVPAYESPIPIYAASIAVLGPGVVRIFAVPR